MGKKSLLIISIISIVLCVGLSFAALKIPFSKGYYLPAVLIIVLALVPFFAFFEGRKIKTSEIVVLSMMIAVSVISRLIFSFVPEVKPLAAFVVISGVAFGANAGFVTGALSIFVSNFFLGQGAFTPFQMLAMGLVGFFAGLMFFGKGRQNRFSVAAFGAAVVLVVYGFIVDTCAVLMMVTDYSVSSVIGIYSSGFLFNVIHAFTTAVVLLIAAKPMNDKFERLRIKYGVFDGDNHA